MCMISSHFVKRVGLVFLCLALFQAGCAWAKNKKSIQFNFDVQTIEHYDQILSAIGHVDPSLGRFMQNNDIETPSIAAAQLDLNDDGTAEYLAYISEWDYPCDIETGCKHHLLMFTNEGELVQIGYIYSRYSHAAVSDNLNDGMRDIYAYDDPENSYSYTTYRWNSENGIYERKDSRQ